MFHLKGLKNRYAICVTVLFWDAIHVVAPAERQFPKEPIINKCGICYANKQKFQFNLTTQMTYFFSILMLGNNIKSSH